MKSAEERVEEYMGGSPEEVGHKPFYSMVELLNEHAKDAERAGFERGVEKAAEKANRARTVYVDGLAAREIIEQEILSLLTQLEEKK